MKPGKALSPIPYGRQSIDAADRRAVDAALRSDYLTQGPRVAEFEAALAKTCGAKYAVACSNGTAALHLACMAAGLGPGDEALVPAITFAATANAAVYCGAKPVFVDVERDTICLDAALAEKACTPKTKAVLPVHFAGQPAAMARVAAFARPRGLTIIEDGAHALGARQGRKPIGACEHSDMVTMSFHPVKHATTGEGGAVLTNREDLRQRLLLLRSHGITRDPALMRKPSEGPWYYEMVALGYNYRVTDIQCALGTSQLAKLERFIARRREIAAAYDEAFSGLDGVSPILEGPGGRHAYHLYVLRLAEPAKRRPLYEFLQSRGVQPNVHYIPVHKLPFYQERGYAGVRLPVAEDYYSRCITIPLHPSMTAAEVRRVIGAVKDGLAA